MQIKNLIPKRLAPSRPIFLPLKELAISQLTVPISQGLGVSEEQTPVSRSQILKSTQINWGVCFPQ